MRHAGIQPDRGVTYREALEMDAGGIAALHADSWRRHYRGAYLDSYLDGDVLPERLAVWSGRLAGPPPGSQYTSVAEEQSAIVGFVHVVFDHDSTWGALLDNLHVRSEFKGNGIGTNLMSRAALGLLRHRPTGSIHLWVLDQNQAAQSFYDARGGIRVESQVRGPFPGGGRALGHRYFWPDASLLVVPEV
jgi:ribosomal protein S18 acetylase RimI-like enzyme